MNMYQKDQFPKNIQKMFIYISPKKNLNIFMNKDFLVFKVIFLKKLPSILQLLMMKNIAVLSFLEPLIAILFKLKIIDFLQSRLISIHTILVQLFGILKVFLKTLLKINNLSFYMKMVAH